MQSLWPFLFGVLIGAGLGVIGLARYWVRSVRNPEIARAILNSAYKNAHPHWLQVSPTDTRAVCPCCGWTEADGKTSEVPAGTPEVPLVEQTEPTKPTV